MFLYAGVYCIKKPNEHSNNYYFHTPQCLSLMTADHEEHRSLELTLISPCRLEMPRHSPSFSFQLSQWSRSNKTTKQLFQVFIRTPPMWKKLNPDHTDMPLLSTETCFLRSYDHHSFFWLGIWLIPLLQSSNFDRNLWSKFTYFSKQSPFLFWAQSETVM